MKHQTEWKEIFLEKARKWTKNQEGDCMCLGNCDDCGFHKCHGCLCVFIPLISSLLAEERKKTIVEILGLTKTFHVLGRKAYHAESWDAGLHDILFKIEKYLVALLAINEPK